MRTAELSNSEQVLLQKAESAELMASTDYWKELMGKLAGEEAQCLLDLEDYLARPYPDRQDVTTLCMKWFAVRRQRTRLLDEVETARRVKANLTQEEPQYGEMYGYPGQPSATERG